VNDRPAFSALTGTVLQNGGSPNPVLTATSAPFEFPAVIGFDLLLLLLLLQLLPLPAMRAAAAAAAARCEVVTAAGSVAAAAAAAATPVAVVGLALVPGKIGRSPESPAVVAAFLSRQLACLCATLFCLPPLG
jgi:hypothetical protein